MFSSLRFPPAFAACLALFLPILVRQSAAEEAVELAINGDAEGLDQWSPNWTFMNGDASLEIDTLRSAAHSGKRAWRCISRSKVGANWFSPPFSLKKGRAYRLS